MKVLLQYLWLSHADLRCVRLAEHWIPVCIHHVCLANAHIIISPVWKSAFSVAGSAKWKNLTVHVRDIGNRDLRIVFSFESNRPYTTQAVTQPNGLQAYRTACYRAIIWTCLFQFSHKTRQTMLLYAYFTPKVDFKRKFNHHPSFLYEWRLTAQTIQKFRIGPSIRIESRIGRTIRNRITSRSFAGP